jgi:hypothetical protein
MQKSDMRAAMMMQRQTFARQRMRSGGGSLRIQMLQVEKESDRLRHAHIDV